ncbi:MAG: PKD domain-containing protein [Bacteroidia bacterium]
MGISHLTSTAKSILAVFLLAISSLHANAQFSQDWCFGSFARIGFGTTPPQGIAGSALYSDEGSACITNAAGQLLFYTNGETVYSRNNTVLQNGAGLRGNPTVTQSSLIIPYPGQANQYLIFTLGRTQDSSGLMYSLVDMSLNGGLGAVVLAQKNVPVLAGAPANALTEKLTATKHCNGTDYWVMVHRYNSNEFLVIPVTSAGVGTPVAQAVGTPHTPAWAINPQRAQKGYMIFSPDGRKIALTLNGPNSNNLVEVFDFDKQTGTISNPLRLPAMGGEYGLAFSPDNGKLFISGGTDTTIGATIGSKNHLSVINMISPNPANTRSMVREEVRTDIRRYSALQNAPDGRIYVVLSLIDALHSINTPNIAPYNYQDSTVFPINGTTRRGLPNFVNDEFSDPFVANFSFEFTCVGQPMSFLDSSLSNARSWLWTFGDAAAGGSDTSSARFPVYTYSTPGIYTVTLIAGAGCGVFDTISKQVEVGQNLPVNLGGDTTFACLGDTVILSSNILSGSFVWSNGQAGGPWTATGDTLSSLEVTTSGWYKLDADNGNCAGSDSTYVFINNNPISVNLGPDLLLCLGESRIIDAQNPGSSYLWSTGDTTQTVTIDRPDTLWVTVFDRGCIASDTIIITVDSSNTVNVMNDTTLCPGEELTINAAPFGNSFNWSTGATTAAITVLDTGSYIVEITTANNCILTDTINVRFRCDTKVFLPNAFRPNSTIPENRIFRPIVQSVDEGFYEFSVYDRWGQEVFRTNNPEIGWDGRIGGADAQPGAYQYVVRFYTNVQRVNTILADTFYLIR